MSILSIGGFPLLSDLRGRFFSPEGTAVTSQGHEPLVAGPNPAAAPEGRQDARRAVVSPLPGLAGR